MTLDSTLEGRQTYRQPSDTTHPQETVKEISIMENQEGNG